MDRSLSLSFSLTEISSPRFPYPLPPIASHTLTVPPLDVSKNVCFVYAVSSGLLWSTFNHYKTYSQSTYLNGFLVILKNKAFASTHILQARRLVWKWPSTKIEFSVMGGRAVGTVKQLFLAVFMKNVVKTFINYADVASYCTA